MPADTAGTISKSPSALLTDRPHLYWTIRETISRAISRTLCSLRHGFNKTINRVRYQTVITLNIHEAKTHLSQYLAKLKHGQTIVLCRRNTPIAEIRALQSARAKPRSVGLGAGKFALPDSFFDPLPKDVLARFEGKMCEVPAGYLHVLMDCGGQRETFGCCEDCVSGQQ